MFPENGQWWNRSQLDLFELFADSASCSRQNMRGPGSDVQFHWHGKFVHMLLDTIIVVNIITSHGMSNLTSMIFQDFNPRPVTEVQSDSPNHIEAALRDVHMRAPNLQLLIVVLPDVTDLLVNMACASLKNLCFGCYMEIEIYSMLYQV